MIEKESSIIHSPQKFQLRKKSIFPPGAKPKTILIHRLPQVYNVIYDNKDVTPKPLNPEVFVPTKERYINAFDITSVTGAESTSTTASAFQTLSVSRMRTQLQHSNPVGNVLVSFAGSMQSHDEEFDFIIKSLSEKSSLSDESIVFEEEFQEQEMKEIPSHVSLILNETNTFIILDLPSSTAFKDTDEGDLIEEQNKHYDFLTSGKGRNRKVIDAEVQTLPILQKTRSTEPTVVDHRDNYAFASNWDMYDTYGQTSSPKPEDKAGSDSDEELHKLIDIGSIDSYKMTIDEKQLLKLIRNPKFLEAACVIERILANNCFNAQQKRFRGLSDPDIFREDIKYNYKLNLLWTFASSSTKGRCVSSMEWNPKNKDLLAVGYGKFYFADNTKGLVLIWNIKNPVQPERQYNFDFPVTTLSFSRHDPNLLAIGFYNGNIYLVNVASRDLQVIGKTSPSFEPVWNVSWHLLEDNQKTTELIFAGFDDGRISVYNVRNTKYLKSQQIMRITKSDGKLKGILTMKKCLQINIPVTRYSSALILRKHPVKKCIYYVGSSEGVIHKCSTNYLNQHVDLFLAHDGPVNEMKFSPFSTKIFATCGDDWIIRIWAEGIQEPLFEMSRNMESVCGIDWSPVHSTILVSISGKKILIWDLQRKVYEPQSITNSPADAKCTVIQFVDNGRCLVVGDIEGNVQIFSLEDMPFPQFFQENIIYQALKRALITKPDVIARLKKIRKKKIYDNGEE